MFCDDEHYIKLADFTTSHIWSPDRLSVRIVVSQLD